jgi:hypothetical protein
MNDRRFKNRVVLDKIVRFVKVERRNKPLRRNKMSIEMDTESATLKIVDKKKTEVITSEFKITKQGILAYFGIEIDGVENEVYLKTDNGEVELDIETFIEGKIVTTIE